MAADTSIPVNVSIFRIIGRLAVIRVAVPKRIAKGGSPRWSIGILKKDVE